MLFLKLTMSGSTTNNETLKSQIVLSNLDKAKRLNAKVITIAKGLPTESFEQMKELCASRDILLLNENNYKQAVEEYFLKATLENTISRKQISSSNIEDFVEYINYWNKPLSKNFL
jgi:hypothetical protein